MISVILPMYNENYNIINLINELKLNNNINEIIIVDDCSTDSSIELIKQLNLKIIKIIMNKENIGQSFSIYKGASAAKNKILVIMDSDGQNDPKYINIMLQKLKESNNTMIMGQRINRTDTISKKIQSFFGNYIRQLILQDNCEDSGCGLKIIYKESFMKLHFINNMHRFMPYLLKIHGMKYQFIKIEDRKRIYGKSNYNIFMRIISLFEMFYIYILWYMTSNLRNNN
jgi:dolichol-phosphate mannosyltransferase